MFGKFGVLCILVTFLLTVAKTYLTLVCTANTGGNAKTGDAKIKNLA